MNAIKPALASTPPAAPVRVSPTPPPAAEAPVPQDKVTASAAPACPAPPSTPTDETRVQQALTRIAADIQNAPADRSHAVFQMSAPVEKKFLGLISYTSHQDLSATNAFERLKKNEPVEFNEFRWETTPSGVKDGEAYGGDTVLTRANTPRSSVASVSEAIDFLKIQAPYYLDHTS